MLSGYEIAKLVDWANTKIDTFHLHKHAGTEPPLFYPMDPTGLEENPNIGRYEGTYALNIFPFDPEQINPNSYNVRLGKHAGYL